MAFADVADLAFDQDFRLRVAACASSEGVSGDPLMWADQNRWPLASQPGFGDAYASAVAGGVQRPGRDASVITDGMLLSAVQSVRGDVPLV